MTMPIKFNYSFVKQCAFSSILLLITISSVEAVVRDGQVDPTVSITPISFNAGAPKINDFAWLPDGKILVGGEFSNISTEAANNIARLNADGTFDASFHGDPNAYVWRILLGPNGETYITGNFSQYGGITRNRIARLYEDGSLDTSFNPNFGTDYVQILAVQPDGKVIVNGTFSSIGGIPRQKLARLNPDGSVDLSFDAGTGNDPFTAINKCLVLPDGKMVLGGTFHSYNGVPRNDVIRINADGSLDTQFVSGLPGSDIRVVDMARTPDGKLYAAGSFDFAETIYRLNEDGTLDTTFDTGGGHGLNGDAVLRVILQSDGRVIIGGGFQGFIVRGVSYVLSRGLFRFNADGSADTDFPARVNGNVPPRVWALARQPDDKILVGGLYTDLNTQRTGGIGRLNQDGTTDTSFVGFLGNLSTINTLVVMPDDKVLIAGDFGSIGTSRHDQGARLNADGTLDESFHLDPALDAQVNDFALQPDGKILIGGSSNGIISTGKGVWRVNADGSLDNSFDTQISTLSSVLTVALQPDGKVLIGGNFTTVNGATRVGLARLNADGSLDASLNANLGGTVRTVLPQSDGKILVGGHINIAGNPIQNIFRLNSDGSVDDSFAIGTGAGDEVFSLLMLPDNRIYVAGAFRNFNGVPRSNIVRLQPNGTLDTSFKQPRLTGITTFSVVVLANGKIVIGGETDASIDASPREKIIRLLPDGAVDYSFDVHSVINRGSAGRVFKLGLQSNGNLLAAGQFDTLNGIRRAGFARLLNFERPTPPAFDFDGDGTSDIGVFRPGSGVWYRRVSYSTITRAAQWGLGSDKIVPADFDGDYRTDLAVFRPSNGTWYWTNSSDNSISAIQFGTSEDMPVPADYDGDHRADVAVFRPSTGIWYWLNSSDGSFHAFQFGTSADKPTVGDFDGDDHSDIAVYRPSTGIWYRMNSSDGSFFGEQFGTAEDLITPADFDGDHRSDLAVFRPSNGYWYIRGSVGGTFTAVPFGTNGDIPVAGDFDGDERADLAVFRPSSGIWYRTDSSTGAFFAVPFGTANDIPVEAAFTN